MQKIICPACLLEGEEDPNEVRSRGLCPKHYQRAKRAGQFDSGDKPLCPRCVSESAEEIGVVQVRGLCRRHYHRARKSGELAAAYASRSEEPKFCAPCEKSGRREPVKAKGLCNAHYGRRYRGSDPESPLREPAGPICTFDGCTNPNYRGGLCAGHNAQQKRGKPLAALKVHKARGGKCEATTCDGRDAANGGLCFTHYQRRRSGDPNWDRPIKKKAAHGTGHTDKHGYRIVYIDGQVRREHVVFMERLLRRPLRKGENVHHLNGNRADNRTGDSLEVVNGKLRSGNLELWSSAQPPGQEIGPKLEWAVEMQEEYAEFVPEELLERMAEVLRGRGWDVSPPGEAGQLPQAG